MPQGVCISSALWNILSDGDSRLESQLNILKNVDDFLLYGRDKAKLEEKLQKFLQFAEKKNLKLNGTLSLKEFFSFMKDITLLNTID